MKLMVIEDDSKDTASTTIWLQLLKQTNDCETVSNLYTSYSSSLYTACRFAVLDSQQNTFILAHL